MVTSASKNVELETRVSLVERDITHMVTMFEKLGTSIDRIADVHQDMKQLLTVHENRLDTHDITTDDIYKEIKDMRRESNEQHNELRDKIISLEKIRWMVIGAGVLVTYAAMTLGMFK